LARKSIFAVGFDLPNIEGFETLTFSSGRSLLDADVIAVKLTLSEFQSYEEYDGRPLLSESSSFKYRELRQHWGKQIATALGAGKTVVFFLTELRISSFTPGLAIFPEQGVIRRLRTLFRKRATMTF
jgi:hypothetical protein